MDSPPPTQNTSPRVFGGLESCQRSLDKDYTSSATIIDKSIRVAHDTLAHLVVSNSDCAGMDLRVGGRKPKPATREVALREWVQGHDKDSEPFLLCHSQGLSTLKRFSASVPA